MENKIEPSEELKRMGTQTKACCPALRRMKIRWFTGENWIKYMPSIEGKDDKIYRVNYCPSCGAYIRNIALQQVMVQHGNGDGC